MHGILNISLDFELHWGRFDKVELNAAGKQYFDHTRRMFPAMVALFKKYEIHVTWAAVGMLYNQNATEWRSNQPSVLPTYSNKNYSSYEWVQANGLTEPQDPYHFAPDLIALLEDCTHFEIATHTYSHYYCREEGQTVEQFRADLQLAKKVAAKRGHPFQSLVFPRNQFHEAYLGVCTELGIETVRSNPAVWYWDANKPESMTKKIFRTGDAYSNLLGTKAVPFSAIDITKNLMQLPASRLYRAWTSKFNILNQLKMKRILQEMTAAAQRNAYYHLWWHPHNFGFHPDECLKELEVILKCYKKLKQQYGFESLTMIETKKFLKGEIR